MVDHDDVMELDAGRETRESFGNLIPIANVGSYWFITDTS
jgi:hypothetical protein